MQGMLAIVLLVFALLIYLWGRRSPILKPQKKPVKSVEPEHPDVVLGLKTESKPVEPQRTPKLPTHRIILFLRASSQRPYGGYELLQSLLSCGLRFGEMNIFHRFQEDSQHQKIIFSVAAATKTGHLNPPDIGDFSCSGLSLFLTLDDDSAPSVYFEMMLDTARQLCEDLGGAVLDDNQHPMTPETMQQIREQIKNFEAKQQTLELFV